MVEDFMCNLKVYRVAQGLTQDNPSLKLAIDISRVLNAPIEDIFIFK